MGKKIVMPQRASRRRVPVGIALAFNVCARMLAQSRWMD
jgi:hypothetical protein